MAEFQVPTSDPDHDETPLTRVWGEGHGNTVYQCLICRRKMQCRNGSGGR